MGKKGKIKILSYVHDMILYMKDSENSIRKSLRMVNTLSKKARCTINTEKSVDFLYTHDKHVGINEWNNTSHNSLKNQSTYLKTNNNKPGRD